MDQKAYRKLDAWQQAVELVATVYTLTKTFPREERFALISQLQRAAVSIPANIAEGYGRLHRGDYVHHLSIARGSLMELETLLIVAAQLRYITRQQALPCWKQLQSVGWLLTALIASLHQPRQRSVRSSTPDPRP